MIKTDGGITQIKGTKSKVIAELIFLGKINRGWRQNNSTFLGSIKYHIWKK